MPNIYRIELSKEERRELIDITKSRRRISPEKVLKARALLLADESDEGTAYNDAKITEALGLQAATLRRLRQRVGEVGPIHALDRKPQSAPSRKSIITGEVESQIIKIACSEAPNGRSDWTLRLIAGKLIEMEVVESISHETVRTVLKKTTSNPG